jgi:threonine dehydrogenase-like Zn-dependent dehydrogenase
MLAPMRALVFDLSIPRYALAKAAGKWAPSLFYGRPSCLRVRDVPEPELRGPDWVKLRPIMTGLCGSDLGAIFFHTSPSISPYSSFPAVLGHEVLARVTEAGSGAHAAGIKVGDRVVVDPWLSCDIRGEAACPRCATGEYPTCERAVSDTRGGGPMHAGMLIGFHKDLPGGFGQAMIAHKSQVFRVPDGVPDTRAVLTEPMAVGFRAAGKRPPREGERVLVIGGGMIAYSVLSALRLEQRPGRVTQLTMLEYQAGIARALGAHAAYAVASLSPNLITERLAADAGATASVVKPILGPSFVVGGYDVIYDCVGTRDSMEQSFRHARAGGTVVLVGASGVLPEMDWSFVWSKELTIQGTLAYGYEADGRTRTFARVLERLGDTSVPLEKLVTHRFHLGQYQDCILANVERAQHQSIKTVITPEEHA